jgi:dolichol-phosphate mannosyltransferase
VLAPLARNEADVVMGTRLAQPGSMTGAHRAGNALLSLGASALYGRRCPDLCTGLWGFRAHTLHALPLRSRGFELEAELFALSARLGFRITHAPTDYLPRKGHSKLSTRDGVRIGWCLLRSRFTPLAPWRGRPSPPGPSASVHPPPKVHA